jgi:ketosteroid isomerase-like protein
MSTTPEMNTAIIRQFFAEVINQGNLARADELFAPNYVLFVSSSPEPLYGPEGIKRVVSANRAALRNFRITADEEIATGDTVVVRWTTRGTHQGALMSPMGPVAATGKPLTQSGVSIFRLADGKIVEQRTTFDSLGMLQQLGVLAGPRSLREGPATTYQLGASTRTTEASTFS